LTGVTFTGSGLPSTFTLEIDGSSYNGILVGTAATGALTITGMNKTLDV
jgi:hypothetical protein